MHSLLRMHENLSCQSIVLGFHLKVYQLGVNMNENYNQLDKELNHLVQIIARLRAEDGCPWDREQTHASLKAACVEEAAEVVGMTAVSSSEEVLVNWAEIKKQEKEGKEWMEDYLPGTFDEAEELIGAARKRKGFKKKK